MRSVVKYFPLPVLVANKNIRKKLEQGYFNSAIFDISSQRSILWGDGGDMFFPISGKGGIKYLLSPPKFMANSRTLSLLFEFAADVFSEIII